MYIKLCYLVFISDTCLCLCALHIMYKAYINCIEFLDCVCQIMAPKLQLSCAFFSIIPLSIFRIVYFFDTSFPLSPVYCEGFIIWPMHLKKLFFSFMIICITETFVGLKL